MKKIIFLLAGLILFISCNKVENPDVNFKQEMRDFVIGISEYSKINNPDFFIIPQNGIELVTSNGEEDGSLENVYLSAIDGNGQEDLFYGYDIDDQATSTNDKIYLRKFLDMSKNAGNIIFVTDYCSTPSKIEDSYYLNNTMGYVSFAANHRELDNIPNYPKPIYRENNKFITTLSEVKNFLYLINLENYNSKSDFINSITSTNFDLLIMDLFFKDGTEFTATEINKLRNKANGGKRLVISYMSIGEAEDYRYYWQSNWHSNNPSWLEDENPDWEGNYRVKYWEAEWQKIIFSDDNSYLKRILDANFNGVYLDIIDAFEYFE